MGWEPVTNAHGRPSAEGVRVSLTTSGGNNKKLRVYLGPQALEALGVEVGEYVVGLRGTGPQSGKLALIPADKGDDRSIKISPLKSNNKQKDGNGSLMISIWPALRNVDNQRAKEVKFKTDKLEDGTCALVITLPDWARRDDNGNFSYA